MILIVDGLVRGISFILVLRSRGDEETWEECQDFFYSRQVVSKGWNFIVLGLKRVSIFKDFSIWITFVQCTKKDSICIPLKPIQWFITKICLYCEKKQDNYYISFFYKRYFCCWCYLCNYIKAFLFIILNQMMKIGQEMFFLLI